MTNYIHSEAASGIGSLRLARPGKYNAATADMYAAIAQILCRWRDDPHIRCVVISGEGKHFCAGNDLGDFLTGYDLSPGTPWRDFLEVITTFPKPVLIAAQGRAVGIGLTWMLLCDVVIVEPDLRASGPFASLGLTPEAASSFTLPALVGPRAAFEVFVLGREIDAQTALDWRIATAISEPGKSLQMAMESAAIIASLPDEGLRQTMSLLRGSAAVSAALQREVSAFQTALDSAQSQALLKGLWERFENKAGS